MYSQPKVSVIIPVYGVQNYIERCARSLFEQTLTDIEYLFIDDCTPDDSITVLKKVLQEYPSRKSHVKIFQMPQNSGQIAVRKFGIEQATGEYIIHCDSDDWIDSSMYEKLYNKALSESLDIVICDYFIAQDFNKKDYIYQDVPLDKMNLLRFVLREKIHSAVWNKLIKSSLYRKQLLYPIYNLREDLCLMTQIVYYSDSIGYLKEPLYYYFYNERSISKDVSNYDKLLSKFQQAVNNYYLLEQFLNSKNLDRIFRKELLGMKYRIKVSFISLTYNNIGFEIWSKAFGSLSLVKLVFLQLPFKLKCSYLLAVTRLHYLFHSLKFKYC